MSEITELSATKPSREEILGGYRRMEADMGADSPSVKILVSYVRPEFLFRSKILTPIHLGRAVETEAMKDGAVSSEDLAWLHSNCLGDDGFDGSISSFNRRIGFFTGTWWARKNYDRLGNPNYFGSCGYRKLFHPSVLVRLGEVDLIAPDAPCGRITAEEQIRFLHGPNYAAILRRVVDAVHPEDSDVLARYLGQSENGFNHEMYVMKKELFFRFCEWMKPMLDWLLGNFPGFIPPERDLSVDPVAARLEAQGHHQFGECDRRDLAFLLERLTGCFLYRCQSVDNLRTLVTPPVTWESAGELAWKRLRMQSLIPELRRKLRSRPAERRKEDHD